MSQVESTKSKAMLLVQSDARAVLRDRTDTLAALKGKRLFITGGTGFLGAWLLEVLRVLNEDYDFRTKATVYSRNSKSFAEQWPHLGSCDWIRFQDGDIRYLAEIPRDTNFVIHAAALADRRLFSSQPTAVAETNSLGTARVLKACLLLENLEKSLLVSSGLVSGEQPWDVDRIDEQFVGPIRCDQVKSVYPESKRMAEVFAHAAISESKLPLVVVRPFALVGPYQSLQLPWAVTDFIRDSFNGGPIRIMGDGSTVRSILYASDFAFSVLAALAVGKPRSTFNLGSPEPIDLITLATMITQFFSPMPEILSKMGQVGHERNRRVPDMSLATKELGFQQTVPLTAALQRTIEWNRLIYGVPSSRSPRWRREEA